ncbi:FAD-dependent oxidoreductase [Bifidobacterium sp. 82T24]|uniref:FAD-dependent oxidoreductase n=1 Tax=Bifidobacterium pluvialisilvae TaxID=2834436 RepID=UPI001C56B394|nr:FAD-dependent oxidoreductase [Bifidobacterium pluvialisilvae]MBW3087704.1 FAD-dependent oxidoreductase [Bifidobacterium pluvialisilvae]
MTTVAIVGCTHAGTFAAQSILQAHPDWDVHVYERNDTLSFLSCGIALWVGDHVSDPKKMFYSSPEALASLGATMHMEHDVLSVDVKGGSLVAKDLKTGEESTLEFDKLVVTTGSKPVTPPIPGLAEGLGDGRVKLCKNWGHGLAIKEMAKSAKKVAVIGAGYIGAELAEQFSEIGVQSVLVDGLDRALAKNFDKPISDVVEQAFTDHGVTLALGHMVTEFRLNDSGTVTVVTSEDEFEVDCAIMGAGFLPRTDLFAGQLDMLKNGAITTDEYMRATISGESEPSQDVFAAGDSATVFYNPTGTYDYIPLATNAVRQALLVGANIVEPTQKYMGTQATSAVQLYDLSLAATGLTQGGAEARGVNVKSTTLTQDFRPAFMLTTTPVTATLTWDPETRKIKGAQFLSKQPDVAQAANAVSIAIQAGFTIDQLANVDLLFQPNFSQPVNYLAAVAMQAVAS